MKKPSVVALLFFVFCLLPYQLMAQTYTVSINQFVEHPALDAVAKGIKDSLAKQGLDINYNLHNAQANMGTANQIAQQMIGEKPDLLIAIATPSAQACAQALTKAPTNMKRPLLFSAVTDPLAAGLVKDINKPGGLITGVSDKLPIKEHLDMVFAFVPEAKRLGILYNSGEANSKSILEDIKKAGKEMGFKVVEATAAKTADVYSAAKSLVGKVDVIFVPTDNTIVSGLESVIKIGIENKLPVFAADVNSVERGAIAAMGFDYYQHGIQTGEMAGKILGGAKPGDIAVEFQKELDLQINAESARKMGVTPPADLLARASKVYGK